MAEVWMVATAEEYEGLCREKLMFDNEEAAGTAAELIDAARREHDRFFDACAAGDSDWNDPNFPPFTVEIMGTKIFLASQTVIKKFEVHS